MDYAVQGTLDELGTPLSQITFVVFDLETTGVSAGEHAITEIGAVKVRGGEVLGEFATLVDPGSPIPPFISVLTGITDSMVVAAPRIESVLPSFLEFAAGSTLVAHNAGFDLGFVRAACAAHGYPPPAHQVVDTVDLARKLLTRDEAPNCKLSTLARIFSGTEPCHRALADARATVDVLHALLERAGSFGVRTLEELKGFVRAPTPSSAASGTWPTRCRRVPASTCSRTRAATLSTSARAPTCATACAVTSPRARPGPASAR